MSGYPVAPGKSQRSWKQSVWVHRPVTRLAAAKLLNIQALLGCESWRQNWGLLLAKDKEAVEPTTGEMGVPA